MLDKFIFFSLKNLYTSKRTYAQGYIIMFQQ
jgi:hypothetical protein